MPVVENFTVAGLNKILDDFEASVDGAIRPAAQAAAQVLYNEVLLNVSQIQQKTGNLRSAIYQAFSAPESRPTARGYAVANYQVSWNWKRAPHGGLIEGGRLQRYVVREGKNGQLYTLVRPEMRGKPKPKKRASQAEKDAYYVTLKGGPRQVPGTFFVRRAIDKFPQASAAALAQMQFALAGGFSQNSNPFEIFE